jgi:hypothetical protein
LFPAGWLLVIYATVSNITRERDWQARHLSESLRQEIMSRIIVQKTGRGISIKVQKGDGF